MRTMVVGIGNPILQDDGVGLQVIASLRSQHLNPDITLETAYTGGMNLLDIIRGYEKVILVDAMKQNGCKAGEVKRFFLPDASSLHSSNPHDVSFAEALLLARRLGEDALPREIIVVGIAVQNTFDFGEQLSKEVAAAVPVAVRMVLKELNST
jgi:hydrogenase maturation protease